MTNLNKIKKDFLKIKSLGFVISTRRNNRDGGIGNTYEDLLGVKENNLKKADYLGFEIKSQRTLNSSYISLFSKSPSHPSKANSYLREKYGEIRDENFPNSKKLYASIFGNKYSVIYDKYKMKLNLSYKDKKLILLIKDLNNKLLDKVYWTFDDLEKASKKMKSLMLVLADEKIEDNKTLYHFNQAQLFQGFSFDAFLREIKTGGIMFDIRIGVHNSGKNLGKTHDHGSGFRVKRSNFKNLYSTFIEI